METINPAAERLYTVNLHSDTYKHMGFHFKIPNASFGINLAMLNCCACVYGYGTVKKSSASPHFSIFCSENVQQCIDM